MDHVIPWVLRFFCTNLQDKMQIRVKTAQEELATIKDFDYGEQRVHGSRTGHHLGDPCEHHCSSLFLACFPCAVVVNRDGQLDDTVAQIEAILVAEKARVARRCGSGDGASVP